MSFSPASLFAQGLLTHRVAVITGGGTGIGRGLALAFAQLGADVVLASRQEGHLNEVADLVRNLGRRALVVPTNIRESAEVERLRDRTREELGRVDFLVNNAGANFLSPALGISPNGWRSIVDVVLHGTFYACRFFGEWMVGEGHGKIVNMAAVNGVVGSPLMAHSGAAKAGVLNLTRTLAAEWAASGVLVNAVAPGAVDTEGAGSRLWADADARRLVTGEVPLGRMARIEDCVAPVLFLCSPAGDYITGSVITVDGGLGLRHVPTAWSGGD